MRIFRLRGQIQEPSDPNTFTGQAKLTRMTGVCDNPQVNVYRVDFKPGARTDWHTHSGPQLLLIVAGRCRFQKEGEPVQEADAGDVVCIEPDERHWHGASERSPTTHLAININARTVWLDKVNDEQYAE